MHELAGSADPYTTPEHFESAVESVATRHFYVVAPRKFLLLYIGTFSVYALFWMYQHWARVKRSTAGTQWPVARSIFSIFFVHSLLERVEERLRQVGVQHEWKPTQVANLVVSLMLLSAIAGRVSAKGFGWPWLDVLTIVLVPVLALVTLPAQKAANAACGDPKGASNASLTGGNIAWLVAGGLFWVLILIGLSIDPSSL